jgi:four helix bundle protein
MSTLFLFENSKPWQRARVLNDRLHRVLVQEKAYRDFMLRDQVNDTAGTLMDDIAIGFGEVEMPDRRVYLERAFGGAAELQSQLYRMLDRSYITGYDFNGYKAMVRELQSMIRQELASIDQAAQQRVFFKLAN